MAMKSTLDIQILPEYYQIMLSNSYKRTLPRHSAVNGLVVQSLNNWKRRPLDKTEHSIGHRSLAKKIVKM